MSKCTSILKLIDPQSAIPHCEPENSEKSLTAALSLLIHTLQRWRECVFRCSDWIKANGKGGCIMFILAFSLDFPIVHSAVLIHQRWLGCQQHIDPHLTPSQDESVEWREWMDGGLVLLKWMDSIHLDTEHTLRVCPALITPSGLLHTLSNTRLSGTFWTLFPKSLWPARQLYSLYTVSKALDVGCHSNNYNLRADLKTSSKRRFL